MARMRVVGSSLDKGYRDDLNYNFGLLEALIGEANGLTDNLREEMLEKVNNLQQQIDMLTGENIGELLERLNDSIQQALTAAQDARTAKTATEEATALATAATELANASALLAEEKANYANEKAVLAQEAADNANQEASNLSQLKIDVVQATQDANVATGNANQATLAAQTATDAINVVLPNVTGLVNLKEWSIETQYKKNNFVTLEGNGYMALRDNKGVKPPSFPVLSNADWAMFVQKGEKGEQGTGVRILGTLPDESALPPLGEPGDAYLINGDLYVWSDTTNDWTNVGTIKGPKGDTGPQGPQGEQGPPGQDADLTEVNQEIASLQQTVTNNQQVVAEHLGQDVFSEDGAHGIRYFNDQLAVKNDQEQWNVVELGGSGEVYQENIVVNATGNALGKATWAESADYFARVGYVDTATNLLLVSSSVGLNVGDTIKLYEGDAASIIDAEVLTIGTPNASGNAQITVNPAEPLSKGIVYAFKSGGTGVNQVALGYAAAAVGDSAFAVGKGAVAKNRGSIAIGSDTKSYADTAVAIGSAAAALGNGSIALMNAVARGGSAFALGTGSTEASGIGSFAIGGNSIASGTRGYAIGNEVLASGNNSHAQNIKTTANIFASTAIGVNNKPLTGQPNNFLATADAFVIGGADYYATTAANAFRVTFDGKAYGKAAYNSTGADYAEYFEWLDGNVNDEDRVGFVVALDGDKIRKATADDTYILGIISANPSVIGDSYQDDWKGRYLTDEWERIRYHWVENYYPSGVLDEEGNEKMELRKSYVAMENPDFIEHEDYIPRENRKEWDAVGLIGKLLVREDGTCEVNSYAKVSADEGTLTASNERTDMRVIERVAPNIVRVFIK